MTIFGQISLSHRVEIGTLLSTMGIFFFIFEKCLEVNFVKNNLDCYSYLPHENY